MSEKEKQIVEKLKEAIPKMSDFDKGYILGVAESAAKESKKTREPKETRDKEIADEGKQGDYRQEVRQ